MKKKKPKGNKLIADCNRRRRARMFVPVGYYKNRPHFFKFDKELNFFTDVGRILRMDSDLIHVISTPYTPIN